MAKSNKGIETKKGRTPVITPHSVWTKQDIKRGNLQSAYAIGAFDKAKKCLEKKGYRIISLEEQAGLRTQEGADSGISRRGNWTREGFIHVPTKGAFLTKDSPIMENAKEATDCHRSNREFYLTNEQVEKSLADSVEVKATQIPTSRFADEALTHFAFGRNAEAYGRFLKESGIDIIHVYLATYATPENSPFARQAWLCWISHTRGKSGLYGGNVMDLDGDEGNRTRGVREPEIKQE